MRTVLRFAGFYEQPSFGLLRGLLYLEACKSHSVIVVVILLSLAVLFFGEQNILVVFWVVGFYRSQHIAAQASQALAKVQHVPLCCKGCDRL